MKQGGTFLEHSCVVVEFSSIQKKRTAAHGDDTCKSIDVIISVMPRMSSRKGHPRVYHAQMIVAPPVKEG